MHFRNGGGRIDTREGGETREVGTSHLKQTRYVTKLSMLLL